MKCGSCGSYVGTIKQDYMLAEHYWFCDACKTRQRATPEEVKRHNVQPAFRVGKIGRGRKEGRI